MPESYDGSIRIKVDVDDKQASEKVKKLSSKYERQLEAVNKQSAAVKRLKEQYDRLTSGTAAPQSVKQMSRDLAAAQKQAIDLDAKLQEVGNRAYMERATSGTVSPETKAQLDDLAARLAEADAKSDSLKRNLNEIHIAPSSSIEAKKLAEDIQMGTEKMGRLKREASSTREAMSNMFDGAGSGAKKAKGVFSGLKNAATGTMKSVGGSVEKVRTSLSGIGKTSKKSFGAAGKHASKFGRRLRTIITGALFFNIISRGLTQLSRTIGKMLKSNAQFAKSLGDIKSNLLTAFQPIYQTILPLLNKFMGALSKVTAQTASFISMIFGTSAAQAQQNAQALYEQAHATEAAGNAAEKAEKQLASFDTIQKLSPPVKTNTDQKPGAPSFTTDFSAIEIPAWIKDWWGVFKKSWEQQGQTTIAAAKKAILGIKDALSAVGKAFMNVWTNGTGLTMLNSIHGLLQNIFLLVGSIGSAFAAAWNNDVGESILTRLFEIITGIFNTAGNLAGKFREAWDANGNGEAIMSAILGIIDSILGTIGRIATSTAKWAANLDLEPLITGIRNVLEPLDGIIAAIGEVLAEIWEKVAQPFAKWVIEKAVPTVLDWLGKLLKFLSENEEIVVAFTKTIILLWAAFKSYTIIMTVIGVFRTLWASLSPVKIILLLLIPLIANVISAWKDMTPLERAISVLGILITVAAAAAIAVGALHSALTIGIAAAAIVAGVVAITAAINSATKRSNASSYTSGLNSYSVPRLANGAVISPNNEFLAVLGDQKHGTNIETPLATMKQAFMEAMNESGGMRGGIPSPSDVYLDGERLARITWSYNRNESTRRGVNLIERGALS